MKFCHNLAFVSFFLMLCSSLCCAGETATLRNGFTIHFQHREPRGEVTRLYLSEAADSFVDVPTDDIIEIETDSTPRAAPQIRPPSNRPVHPVDLDQALSAASHNNNLSPDLLRSVIRAESGFNPKARSVKGAQGLMQLMPETAARMGVKDPWDPGENVEGGARYLSQLLGRYHNNLPIALAAYNAGPERVQQYHGIPPYPETIAYVSRVLRDLNQPRRTTFIQALDGTSTHLRKNSEHVHPATLVDSKSVDVANGNDVAGTPEEQPGAASTDPE
jgi:hypothetical protein